MELCVLREVYYVKNLRNTLLYLYSRQKTGCARLFLAAHIFAYYMHSTHSTQPMSHASTLATTDASPDLSQRACANYQRKRAQSSHAVLQPPVAERSSRIKPYILFSRNKQPKPPASRSSE